MGTDCKEHNVLDMQMGRDGEDGKVPVKKPWSDVLAPISAVTEEREKEPVAVLAEKAEPARLATPSAKSSCVALTSYLHIKVPRFQTLGAASKSQDAMMANDMTSRWQHGQITNKANLHIGCNPLYLYHTFHLHIYGLVTSYSKLWMLFFNLGQA